MSFYASDYYVIFMKLCKILNFSKLILHLSDRNMIENHPNRDFLSQFYPKAEELTLGN